jgi:hypothetical protein
MEDRAEEGVVTGFPALLLRTEGAYGPPAALAFVGVAFGNRPATAIALIWFGHIGMDRLLGPTASSTRPPSDTLTSA